MVELPVVVVVILWANMPRDFTENPQVQQQPLHLYAILHLNHATGDTS